MSKLNVRKGDNRRVSWNANTYVDKGEKGKGKGKTPEEREEAREDARDRLRRNATTDEDYPFRGRLCDWLLASDLHSWPISSVTL